MLTRLAWLEGIERKALFEATPLARVRQRALEGLSVRATAASVGQSKRSVARVIREMGGVNKIREGA